MRRALAARYAARWRPHSRLMLVSEPADWSIAHDMRELAAIARVLGIELASPRFLNASTGQSVFFGSQFSLLRRDAVLPQHAVATAYFHGRPGTDGSPEFDEAFESLQRLHEGIERIQVTHAEMRRVVLSAGVAPERVHTIRIGVDTDVFALRTAAERESTRAKLGIPPGAFVAGSFQKDGVGWGEGLEPKLVKGPDVLVAALDLVRARIPELFVLLSGPARGYVRTALERMGIPYAHRYLPSLEDLRSLYVACDAVVVASRQEGGPKAVLEAMAVGVPVVSTRVGQAQELIDGSNGALVEVDDVDALAAAVCASAGPDAARVEAGRKTAEANAYSTQVPLWDAFFEGFVSRRR